MIVSPKINNLVNLYHENKFSHAFLFVTNDINRCNKDIIELIKTISCPHNYEEHCNKCNLCYQITKEVLPNIIQVYPDGMNIKKEQVLAIQEKFKGKPLYLKNNFYIINYAEKLNSSSANTMLKFLEEPEENIIGFFITNNKEKVLDTIKSRCQIIIVNYQERDTKELLNLNSEDFEILKTISIKYLDKLLIKKENGITLNKLLLTPNINNRNEANNYLLYWYYLFNDIINNKKLNSEFEFLENISLEKIININKIIYESLNNITYNLNIELLFDKFTLDIKKVLE